MPSGEKEDSEGTFFSELCESVSVGSLVLPALGCSSADVSVGESSSEVDSERGPI